MKQVFIVIAAIMAVAVIGCSGLKEMSQKGAYQDTTKAYAHSMRWSDFDTATIFVRQPNAPSPEFLKNIKITNYEVKHNLVVQEGARLRQIASIAYFKKSDMLLKTISTEEIWEFNEAEEQWYLVKGFPDFK